MSKPVAVGDDEPMVMQLADLTEVADAVEGPAVPPELIDNLSVEITVELGRLSLRLGSVRGLQQGEVLSLDRPVGEPLDIRINGRTIARGEVVATEARRYGIRITEIVARRSAAKQ
jgi:flagellar motor switch protein FliN/FliY